jgi:hypothetical protein
MHHLKEKKIIIDGTRPSYVYYVVANLSMKGLQQELN